MQNIENYTLTYVHKYWDVYLDFVKKNKERDIDFPDYKLSTK